MAPSRSSKLTPVFVTTPYSCLLVDSNFLFTCLLLASEGFPGGSAGEESACNVGDLGSVPGAGRSPGEGNSILQYSGLENSMDTVHGVAKNQTRLSDFHQLRILSDGIFPTALKCSRAERGGKPRVSQLGSPHPPNPLQEAHTAGSKHGH